MLAANRTQEEMPAVQSGAICRIVRPDPPPVRKARKIHRQTVDGHESGEMRQAHRDWNAASYRARAE